MRPAVRRWSRQEHSEGHSAAVVDRLIIVTDPSLSAPLRKTAFQLAGSIAANNVKAIATEVIAGLPRAIYPATLLLEQGTALFLDFHSALAPPCHSCSIHPRGPGSEGFQNSRPYRLLRRAAEIAKYRYRRGRRLERVLYFRRPNHVAYSFR
jgi:hypothetical protein